MFKSLFSEVHFHTTFFLSGLVQWHTILDIRTRSKRGGTYIALSYQIHTPGNFLLLMTLEFPEHQKVLLLNTHRNIPVWDSWDCPGPESSQHLVLLPSFSRQFQVVPADLGSSRNPGSSDSLIFYFLGEYSNHWLTLYFLSYLAHTWKERLQTPIIKRENRTAGNAVWCLIWGIKFKIHIQSLHFLPGSGLIMLAATSENTARQRLTCDCACSFFSSGCVSLKLFLWAINDSENCETKKIMH